MNTRRFVDVSADYIPNEIALINQRVVDDIYVLLDKISKFECFAVFYVNTRGGPIIIEGQNYVFDEPSQFVLDAEKDRKLHDHLRLKAACHES
jgi:hypothetical protein